MVGNRFIGFDHEHLSTKQKSFNDCSNKYFCCNTTKHNGNSANIIHTQNALQVYERKSAMSWRLIDETTLRIYMRQHLQTKTGKDTHLLQISPQKDTISQLDFMGNHLLTLLIKLTLYKPGLIK